MIVVADVATGEWGKVFVVDVVSFVVMVAHDLFILMIQTIVTFLFFMNLFPNVVGVTNNTLVLGDIAVIVVVVVVVFIVTREDRVIGG